MSLLQITSTHVTGYDASIAYTYSGSNALAYTIDGSPPNSVTQSPIELTGLSMGNHTVVIIDIVNNSNTDQSTFSVYGVSLGTVTITNEDVSIPYQYNNGGSLHYNLNGGSNVAVTSSPIVLTGLVNGSYTIVLSDSQFTDTKTFTMTHGVKTLTRKIGVDGKQHWFSEFIVKNDSGNSQTVAASQAELSTAIGGIQTTLNGLQDPVTGILKTAENYADNAVTNVDISSQLTTALGTAQGYATTAQGNAETYADGKVLSNTGISWTTNVTDSKAPSQLAVKNFIENEIVATFVDDNVDSLSSNPSDILAPSEAAVVAYVASEASARVDNAPTWTNPSSTSAPSEAAIVAFLLSKGLIQ